MENLGADRLLERLTYRFVDPTLLRQALTHKSHANENPGRGAGDNERLEFLGDAVLDFVLSDLLLKKFVDLSEGDLSKIRAGLVSETGLAEVARELELGPCLLIGKGEEKSGGREKNSILSDTLEALLAAVYLDSSKAGRSGEIHRVIGEIFLPRLPAAEQNLHFSDFKTELQESVQKRYKETVSYRIVTEEGPDHEKRFEVAVIFREKEIGRGEGRTKKSAEQEAAKTAIRNSPTGSVELAP